MDAQMTFVHFHYSNQDEPRGMGKVYIKDATDEKVLAAVAEALEMGANYIIINRDEHMRAH